MPIKLPDVDIIELDDVKFYVVTEKNIDAVFEELQKKNYDPVIFGVTDDGYEMMSVNQAKILQLVQQQKALIISYKEYYQRQTNVVEEHNKKQDQNIPTSPKEKEWWELWK